MDFGAPGAKRPFDRPRAEVRWKSIFVSSRGTPQR